MVYYSTSCGNLSGWKGIRASELASVKHRGTDYDDIYPEIPSDEELYGEDEDEEDTRGIDYGLQRRK